MKKNTFWEFVLKNKYVIIFVSIVLVIALCGWMEKIMEIVFTIGLIILAIYLGKRIQDDEKYINTTLSRKIEEIKENNYVLTPGRYVGTEEQEDDGVPFEEKMKILTTELKAQFEEAGATVELK